MISIQRLGDVSKQEGDLFVLLRLFLCHELGFGVQCRAVSVALNALKLGRKWSLSWSR